MRLLHLLLALALLLLVAADTEILTISVRPLRDLGTLPLPPPDTYATPTPHVADISIHLTPSVRHTDVVSHNRSRLKFALDLPPGEWTARISWPASTPAKIYLGSSTARAGVGAGGGDGGGGGAGEGDGGGDVKGEREGEGNGDREGRRLTVLHVLGMPLSPRIPYPGQRPDEEFETTFHILVEPMLLGVLPQTAVSAVVALVVCVGVAVWVAPRAMEALMDVVQWVNEDERVKEE